MKSDTYPPLNIAVPRLAGLILISFFISLQLVASRSSSSTGKGKNVEGSVKYGFCLVKGKADHPMEDYHVAKFVQIQGKELGLFAIYDGHLGDRVPAYLQKHLLTNIIKEVGSSYLLC